MTSSSFLTGQQTQRAHWSLLTLWSCSHLRDVRDILAQTYQKLVFLAIEEEQKYWNWSILVKTQIHKSAIPTNYTKWQCLMRRAPTVGGELVSYRLQSLCSRAHTDTNGKHVSVRRAAVVRRKQSLKEIPSWQCLCVAVQRYVMAWENGKEHHRGCTEMENEKQGKRSQWRWKWEYVLINNGRSEKQYSIL